LDPAAGVVRDNLMTASIGTVFLVDDDPGVIAAIARLLRAAEFEVRSFSSPRDFLREHDASIPGCAVLDVAMPGLNGIELHRALVDAGCERPIIFLTGHGDIPMSVQAMRSGAVDFLTKPVHEEKLLAAVCRAIEEDRTDRLAQAELADISERLATLTPRESEILRFVVAGRLNKQIAAHVGAAEKTVKVHRARIMIKIGVRSVAELVRVTILAGIAPAEDGSNR
jgi:FixJ family two-component response regulator